MQKHNYNFLLLMVLVAFSIVFTGCKKDDEPSVSTKAQLTTGIWKTVSRQFINSVDGKEVSNETKTPEGTQTWEFKSDGTVTVITTDSEGNKDTGTAKWELSNGDKTLTFIYSADDKEVATLKEISASKMILTTLMTESSDGQTVKYETIVTFSK
ncbi:hypothetical protein QNI19_04205 [Cytophagaceae bacterium DM2B3-1]|uniref:Lipocalin-like domain-containing protein n=1 Tax=Xanthocytophaga flava TaxID=3048013 RepID=A0ABT7CEJ4_9BACT|nr:hypothetical protein [Xanthocytophaga flavus]MDJ1468947.1 hypothetical protein [Xanthocytophaga flavus]MDJ1492121.1 hypothetical protein [Xanthocytophaga flavus]